LIDRDDFERFYCRSLPRFAAFARRLAGSEAAAQEVVQEAYFRLLRAPFSSPDDEERRRYLYRIAVNLMKREWTRIVPEPLGVAASVAANEPQADLDVQRALAQLTPRDRALLWLAYVEGRSHKEIAAITGVGALSVRVLLSRARKRFEQRMEEP
jgi:RNA polymerase sigma-70 factor (ECF subfamily)